MRGVVDGLSPMGARTAIMVFRKRYLFLRHNRPADEQVD